MINHTRNQHTDGAKKERKIIDTCTCTWYINIQPAFRKIQASDFIQVVLCVYAATYSMGPRPTTLSANEWEKKIDNKSEKTTAILAEYSSKWCCIRYPRCSQLVLTSCRYHFVSVNPTMVSYLSRKKSSIVATLSFFLSFTFRPFLFSPDFVMRLMMRIFNTAAIIFCCRRSGVFNSEAAVDRMVEWWRYYCFLRAGQAK